MKTRNIIMLSVLVVLFVTAGVLVIVGVTTHTEPGFVAPQNSWDHIGLTVGCRVYPDVDPEDPECGAVQHAVGVINSRLGFTMMRYVTEATAAADVTVTLGVPQDATGQTQHAGGFTVLEGSGTTYTHCEVTTTNTGTSEMRGLVLEHELGCHCLGLEHDDYESSICRAVQSSTPDRAFPPRLSDFDRTLLRGKYAD